MELDEALVRQQLAARGVPADSIPDEVLRQVLRDFKELDVGEDGAARPLTVKLEARGLKIPQCTLGSNADSRQLAFHCDDTTSAARCI